LSGIIGGVVELKQPYRGRTAIPKPKIAFVVGHEHWGKSWTLRALTNGKKKYTIKTVEFFIRRMSNDDIPDSFEKFWKSIDPTKKPNVIATLCPKFEDTDSATKLVPEVLEKLREKGYQLFFWVMKNRCKPIRNRTNEISEGEISELRNYGYVEVVSEIQEPSEMADKFKRFVTDVVLA